jgi:hypothetical protein
MFPEPVQVIMVTPMGKSIKLIGKGLTSGKVHDPILSAEQMAHPEATPEKEPFDGDPKRLRETTGLHLDGVIYLEGFGHATLDTAERPVLASPRSSRYLVSSPGSALPRPVLLRRSRLPPGGGFPTSYRVWSLQTV